MPRSIPPSPPRRPPPLRPSQWGKSDRWARKFGWKWSGRNCKDNFSHVWSLRTRNKIGYELLVSKSSKLGSKIWPLRKRPYIYGTFFLPINWKEKKPSIHSPLSSACIGMFQFFQKIIFDPNTCTLPKSPNNGFRWCPLGKLPHMGLEQLC